MNGAIGTVVLATSLLIGNTVFAQEDADRVLFDKVVSHLDMGGRFFGYLNVSHQLEAYIEEADAFIREMAASAEVDIQIPEELNFKGIMEDLGIAQVQALAFSAVAKGSGYHSKGLIALKEPRTGILKLLGGGPQPFAVTSFAPSSAQFAFEKDLTLSALKEVVVSLSKRLESVTKPETLEEHLKKPVPNAPFTWEELLVKASGRLSGFVVTREEKLELPEEAPFEFQAMDLVITHDKGAWIYEQLAPLLAMLPDEMANRSMDETFEQVEITLPPQAALGFYKPVIRMDKASGRLHIASRQVVLDQALGEGKKLTDSVAYQTAMKGLPVEGNAMTYISQDIRKLFAEVIRSGFEESLQEQGEDLPEALVEWMVEWIGPDISQASASVFTNTPDGFKFVSNSSTSISSTVTSLAVVTPIAIMATVATPMIGKARATARIIPESKQMQGLLTHLYLYSGDFGGVFPEELDDLFPDIAEDKATLKMLSGEDYHYISGFTDSDRGDTIILHAPARGLEGEHLVGFLDGSVRRVKEAEFRQLLESQKKD